MLGKKRSRPVEVKLELPKKHQAAWEWYGISRDAGGGGVGGMDGGLVLRNSEKKGVSVFAGKDFAVGDVVCTIPCSIMHGCTQATWSCSWAVLLMQAAANGTHAMHDLITAELLLWVGLVLDLETDNTNSSNADDSSAVDGPLTIPYIVSLDDTAPTPESWTDEERTWLGESNVAGTCQASLARLQEQVCAIEAVAKAGTSSGHRQLRRVTLLNLTWAKGLYLSRRYPGRFLGRRGGDIPSSSVVAALSSSNSSSSGGGGGGDNGTGASASASASSLSREHDLGSDSGQGLGCMVPVLDLFNHDSSRQWLSLAVDDDSQCLVVSAAHPLATGDEVLSNYGPLTNEQLLRAYGFAEPYNPHDTVSVRLHARDAASGLVVSSRAMELGPGGLAAVPVGVWATIREFCGGSDGDGDAGDGNGNGNGDGDEENEGQEGCIGVEPEDLDCLLQWALGWLKRQPKPPAQPPHSSASSRMAFVRQYLVGQRRIVKALARDLQEVLAHFEEEGEEGGD